MGLKFAKNRPAIWVIGILLLIPYVLGLFLPEQFWGTHFIFFLPSQWSMFWILVIFGIIAYAIHKIKEDQIPVLDSIFSDYVLFGIALFMGILFYQFPIVNDYYGNARSFIPLLPKHVTQLPEQFYSELFSFKFEPGNGRKGVMLLYTWVAKTVGITYGQVFLWMGAICGASFIFMWLKAVHSMIKSTQWKLILSLGGLCSPFLLIYFGHIDTYAPLYLLFIGWLFLLIRQMRTKNIFLFIPLVLMLIVGIRFHTLMYLLIPSLLLAIWHQYDQDLRVQRILTFKGVILWFYLPVCAVGTYLYFFVFKDYNDPRKLDVFKDIDRLFLPIISPGAPLDRYNLFSWNHIFDYLNILFLWSPLVLFLMLIVIFIYRKKVINHQPETAVIWLTFLIFATVLFMFNPLMSMPMDWDLFLFPAPILMVLLLLLVQQIETFPLQKNVLIIGVALSLITIPMFIVHQSNTNSSHRLEQVARHIYKTYYEHSGTYLLYSLQMIPDNSQLYISRKNQLIKDLKPFALIGKDEKYASLLTDDGIYKLRHIKDYQAAQSDFELAHQYYPNGGENILYLMETNFILKDYTKAYKNALLLIKMKYPSLNQALLYGVHCSLEAEMYDEGLILCNAYLEEAPQNNLIKKIALRLSKQEKIEELKLLFKQHN